MNASCPVDPLRPGERRVGTSEDGSPLLGTDPDHTHQGVMCRRRRSCRTAAARTRLLMPGSPASQAVDEVVPYFTTPPAQRSCRRRIPPG